jgi:nicotinamidase-related amidase
MSKVALLIIDPQYDFCNPLGALFVAGADEDMKRLSVFINKNQRSIDKIFISMDWHPLIAIFHPSFWQDFEGYPPMPFTQILKKDVEAGTWTPKADKDKVIAYLSALEEQGEFPHIIWPTHCLAGSLGASLDETLMRAVRAWAESGKIYELIIKGTHQLTEHFGIFMSQIPVPDAIETGLNKELIEKLDQFDTIYLAGEARSHCVATSLNQLMKHAPAVAQKVVIVSDCMSDVSNLGYLADPIFAEAEKRGIRKVEHSVILN